MNKLIEQIAEHATTYIEPTATSGEGWIFDKEKFAMLIIAECTTVLFDESEKLFELCSEENNMSTSQEYELCSNQCVNNIALIEKHFGVDK